MNLETSLVSWLIILVTVGVSLLAFDKPEISYKLIFNPFRVDKDKEWYRFLTSGFIHADTMHLVFNMISMYFFSRHVEAYFILYFGKIGSLNYLFMYLLCIVLANVSTFYKYRHTAFYNSLGASGGVSGVLLAFVVFNPFEKIYPMGIPMPGWLFAAIFLGYSSYMGKKGKDNINHDAHFWGALVGAVYVIVQKPSLITRFFTS